MHVLRWINNYACWACLLSHLILLNILTCFGWQITRYKIFWVILMEETAVEMKKKRVCLWWVVALAWPTSTSSNQSSIILRMCCLSYVLILLIRIWKMISVFVTTHVHASSCLKSQSSKLSKQVYVLSFDGGNISKKQKTTLEICLVEFLNTFSMKIFLEKIEKLENTVA